MICFASISVKSPETSFDVSILNFLSLTAIAIKIPRLFLESPIFQCLATSLEVSSIDESILSTI